MAKWVRLGRTRRTCGEIVIAPRGRRRTLYLVKCGRPAQWLYATSWGMPMHRCDEHKRLSDAVVKCAVEAAKRICPPVSLIR